MRINMTERMNPAILGRVATFFLLCVGLAKLGLSPDAVSDFAALVGGLLTWQRTAVGRAALR